MWALSHIETRSEATALPCLAGQGRSYQPPCPSTTVTTTTKYYVG